jgi:hypothetical protein
MAAPHDLVPVSPDELSSVPGFATIRKHSAKFPRRAVSAAELRARQQRFIKSTAPPTVTQPRPKRVEAVRLTTAQLTKLRAVHDSEAATAELVAQKLHPDQTLGLTYSAVAALEYTKLKAERQRRLKKGEDRARVDAQWEKIVDAARDAFAAGGMTNVTESGVERMAKELSRSRANFNAVVDIANSATDVVASGGPKLAYGNFVTVVGRLADFFDVVVVPVPPNLCERPIQGRYTKHLSASFSLSVRITVWCPTWTNPFRTCTKTFTIASVTFSAGLEVNYRITCCGATASGAAYTQICASIVGITVCASCSAKVTGVAGIAKSGSGSSCTYGLGVVAELKCTVAGVTVFQASAPYGWTITGPCPPASLPC